MSIVDPLVEDYLRRLDRAAAELPPDRRSDLVEEIGEHIATARATGAGNDEAAVRTVLDRLGEPEEIVAAAREDVPPGWGTRGPYDVNAGAPPPLVAQPRGTGRELAAVLLLTVGSFLPLVGWLVGVVLLWTSSLWRRREKLLGTLVVPLGPGSVLYVAPLLLGAGETCRAAGAGLQGVSSLPPEAQQPTVPLPVPAAPQPVPPGPPPLPDLPPPPDGDVLVCEATGFSGWWLGGITLGTVVAAVLVAVTLFRIARRRAADAPPTMLVAHGTTPSPWGGLETSAVLLLGLGGFLVPVVGALVGLGLACASPRWAVRDKVVAGALVLGPGLLLLVSFALPAPVLPLPLGPGGWEALLLLLLTGPLAAVYLAAVLQRGAPVTDTTTARRP